MILEWLYLCRQNLKQHDQLEHGDDRDRDANRHVGPAINPAFTVFWIRFGFCHRTSLVWRPLTWVHLKRIGKRSDRLVLHPGCPVFSLKRSVGARSHPV